MSLARMLRDLFGPSEVEPAAPESPDDLEPVQAHHEPALFRAIEGDLDDSHPYLVYADWLQQQGDPRGELITLQAAMLHETDHERLAALKQQERALLLRFPAHFLGSATHNDSVSVRWHLGWIRSARVGYPAYGGNGEVAHLLTDLLDHPSGQLLRDLELGMVDEGNFDPLLQILVAERRPHLRSLFVGAFTDEQTELSWTHCQLPHAFWKALPGLERLVIHAGAIWIGYPEAHRLRHLELRTGGLTTEVLDSLFSRDWPQLSTLKLWFGDENYGANCTVSDLDPLWSGERFPALRHLGLQNADFTDAIALRLTESPPLLSQLSTLDLSLGTLSPGGVPHLASAPLDHLERLDLSENYLDGVDGLDRLAPEVIVGRQEEDGGDPDWRFVSVSE